MKLTSRLMAVAKLIDKCNTVADIGTDHAYIPIYCVKNNICKNAIACDVNRGPLDIARKNIESYGMDKKIYIRQSDGLKNYKKDEADCIVIAGMGGLLTIDIIKDSITKISENTVLILQPMIAVYEVRKFLSENGFCIVDEVLAQEENKIYNIIKCRKGEQYLSEYEMYVGKKLIENQDELLLSHMDKKIYTITKVINGLKNSMGKEKEISDNEKILSYYKKARKG